MGSATSRCRRLRGPAAAGLSLAGIVLSTSGAAQPVPRIEVEVRTLASANPLLVTGENRGAALVEITARPGVRFADATGTSFDLGAVVTRRQYSRRYGGFLVGRVDAVAERRESEFLSYGVAATYSRDVAIDLLTSSVEGAADPTAIRTAFTARASLTWHPDEYTWILPELGFERYRYDRSALVGDTRAVSASLGLRRRMSPLTTIGVRAGTILSDTARLSATDTQFLYGTVDHRLNARWRVTGELGAERIGARIERLLGITAAQPARVRLSGRGQLCREAPGPVICAAAALNSEVSGLGGLQRRAVLTASVDHRLGEHVTMALDAEYQRTVMQGGFFPEFDAIRTVATVERTLRRDLRLGGTVQYLRRRLVDGTRVGAVFAGFQLVFTPQLR